jgi:glycosyltransferase involved in cell wall biosynthesis
MTISGFSMARNAISLDYPLVESIRSLLPLCDEVVVAVGRSEDDTLERVRALGDARVRVIETVWDPAHFVHGAVNAVQTNIALEACRGEWCVYLQADEVLHEEDIPALRAAIERAGPDERVEGLLFDYLHFWGSYDRIQTAHHWYRHEVRAIRNGRGIRSWKSAQGFRLDGRKLRVRRSGARIFHYGWVRHPLRMKRKQIALDSVHHDADWVKRRHPDAASAFDYGDLRALARFRGTHPAVMRERIAAKDWNAPIEGEGRMRHRHEKLSSRVLSFIENRVLHTRVGEYRNYVLID